MPNEVKQLPTTSRLHRRFASAPEECFAGLETAMAEIDRRIGESEDAREELGDLFDRLVKRMTCRPPGRQPATGWSWDARQPAIYFANGFHARTIAGAPARWVGASGILRMNLRLPRVLQYDFAIEVAEFALPEYRDSLYIRVDDWRRYGWLASDGGRYETIILEDPSKSDVAIEIGVGGRTRSESDVTFAVARIDARRRG